MCQDIIRHPGDFIAMRGDALKTTSLKVAEAFGRQHSHVLRKLEGLDCSPEFNASNFGLVDYTDAKGEQRPLWEMTKDGFMFLVMGFTGKRAAGIKEAYINAFNAMADELAGKPSPPALPAKVDPRSLYDLDYVRDCRDDDSRLGNVGWWEFERAGGRRSMATAADDAQGDAFFRQTQRLAQRRGCDAEQAITWSLMRLMGGEVEGVGHFGCELRFCEGIARAAVAWMIAAGPEAVPPEHRARGRPAGR